MLVGYCRSSTSEQIAGLEAQERQLLATGCTKIMREMVSSVAVRLQLDAALDFVREGDVFVVTRLDRLARSTTDLLSIVGKLEAKGVGLRILDFGGSEMDTKSPSGRMLEIPPVWYAAVLKKFLPYVDITCGAVGIAVVTL